MTSLIFTINNNKATYLRPKSMFVHSISVWVVKLYIIMMKEMIATPARAVCSAMCINFVKMWWMKCTSSSTSGHRARATYVYSSRKLWQIIEKHYLINLLSTQNSWSFSWLFYITSSKIATCGINLFSVYISDKLATAIHVRYFSSMPVGSRRQSCQC